MRGPTLMDGRGSPCLGCPDKCPEPNCHTDCRKYRAWLEEQEQIRQARRGYTPPIWKYGDRDSRRR